MRHRHRWAVLIALLVALAVGLAACGGDDSAAPAEPPAAEPEAPAEEPAPEPAPEPEPPAEEPEPEPPAEPPAEPEPPAEAAGEPIKIGHAADLTANMAPFDGPAAAAAQYQIEQINAAGGVDGRPLEYELIDTQLDPEQTKQAAIDLIEGGADILLVTCDVDFATPAIQEAITRGVLAVAPCIGTDQMGPKRFGEQGKLAFTTGNIAQDEGAAMAEWAFAQGWTRAGIAKDNVIVYFQNIVDAFAARFEELGGEVVATQEWVNGDGTIGNVASSLASEDLDVIATSTGFGDLPGLVDGIRSLGNDVPIICSWACDGTYWNPPNLSNFYLVTYASISGDDPNPDVQALADALGAQDPLLVGTGGFVTGATAIDAIALAISEAGSTDGAALAEVMEGFQGVETISGSVSYSPDFHGVTGREYRVMEIQNGELKFIELFAASEVPDIGS